MSRNLPTRARRAVLPAALVLGLGLSLGTSVPAGADPTASPLEGFGHAQKGHAGRRSEVYTPHTGVHTSDPRTKNKRDVIATIVKAIEATRPRQTIQIATWNLASPVVVRELLRANDRGVTVRLLAAKQKVEQQPKSGDYWRLKRGLHAVSKKHPQAANARSWARACDRSCRGNRGIAHSKYYLFSKVGTAENIVMSSSANATEVAANSQWNDVFVLTDNKPIYDLFVGVFKESTKDRLVKPGFVTARTENYLGYSYPWSGASARGDRAMNELKRITCKGARGAGVNGRTRIRIAQDAIIDKRGQALAQRLRTLYQDGCNIRIVYSLMNTAAKRTLQHTSRGPVPMRQIVQDFDGDGVYDRYLHAKVMTLSGYYRDDRGATISWQGSENWSGLAKISDEQGMKIYRPQVERRYASWIDGLFAHPPARTGSTGTAEFRRIPGVDPYQTIRANLG